MKRFVCFVLVMVLALSLCACGGKHDYQGNPVEGGNGDVVLEYTGEFTLSKIDKSDYYSSGCGHHTDFTAVISNDEYSALISINAEQYTLWTDGDTVTGTLEATIISGYPRPQADFYVGDTHFDVYWYGASK